jgi:2',3'-cyclic-nucleotide 2'-phosphodiesterase (5'-nucleotidase family)
MYLLILVFFTVSSLAGCDKKDKQDKGNKINEVPTEDILTLNNDPVSEKPTPLTNDDSSALSSDLPPIPARKGISEDKSLTLIYSTGVSGELVDCGCPKHPLGGIARRTKFIEDIKKARKALQFDGGELFFAGRGTLTKQSEMSLKSAKVLARAFSKQDIDVINVGKYDLSGGVEFLLNDLMKNSDGNELPLISANIVKDGERILPPYKIIEMDGALIGVFGITDTAINIPPPAGNTQNNPFGQGIDFLDPNQTVKQMVEALGGRVDLIIGLYSMPFKKASELARDVPGADIIIVSERAAQRRQRPLVLGDSLVFQAGNRGMYLGRMDLTLSPEGKKDAMPKAERAKLNSELAKIYAQKKILDGPARRKDPEIKALYREMANREKELTEKLEAGISNFKYSHSLVGVELEWEEDPEVSGWVEEIGVKARTPNKKEKNH